MYKEKKEWLKYLFPVMMFSVAGLLMPAWLEATEGSYLQFLSFLTCAAIMFVGAVPNFKATKLESAVDNLQNRVSRLEGNMYPQAVDYNSYPHYPLYPQSPKPLYFKGF